MVRKPGRMYRKISSRAYTRREYIGGVPASRITQFDLGNKNADFNTVLHLAVDEDCQIRHSSLESARVAAVRHLSKKIGLVGYHLKVRVYPHHVLRENKMATGAGADRVSEGMRRSFGKPVGSAARVKKGQNVMTVRFDSKNIESAKKALKKAGHKLPSPCHLVFK